MMSPTLDRILDAVLCVDARLEIKFLSEPGQRWLNGTATTELPTNLREVLHSNDLDLLQHSFLSSPNAFSCDVRIVRGGRERWVNVRGYELPAGHQFVLCLIDISAWKSTYRHAAEHDELTGLPNRAFLKKAVDMLLQDPNRPFSVALLDLDGFKNINDNFGHAMGDAVLVETANRLAKSVGAANVLARLGGDEFVLLFDNRSALAAKESLAGVLLAMAKPFGTAPHNAHLGASIGVAEYPAHGADYSTLLRNADTAMYRSKLAGKNQVSIFIPTERSEDFSLKAAIHAGIEKGEFYLEYQPQFDIRRNVVGAEALVRWINRDLGRVPPDKFIPIVEQSGLMPFLGKWALRSASLQLKVFQNLMPGFVMSVNVSPVQFGGDDFDNLVLDAIAEADIDPATLVLEITESTLMQSQERTERALVTLREKGVRFSIDDFGTGFSSLAYLTRLPVSSIKIDQAFVRAIGSENSAAAPGRKLITAMIHLAHSIDLKVVAEGVETEAQFAFLEAAGCNLIQGYLLGSPVGAPAIHELLKRSAKVTA
ncbi:MAG TPA: bifunctional diguanylate cyclase/phosphodiesterase [Clostridia bacterium]|nr:bifunctional diguanylate cyclase/phosphodiesterase [Clostridia bacterium]